MFEDMIRKAMKPILKEVYAEGYNAGSDDTSRRMHEIYNYGIINGYQMAKAEVEELDPDVFDEMAKEMEANK